MVKITLTDHHGNDRDIDLDQLFKATTPKVKCSAECDHGCGIEVPENGDWPTAAIKDGWIVQLWRTPYAEHVGDHIVLFCDQVCCYEWMRKRLRETARMGERISHVCAEHNRQFSPGPGQLPHEQWLVHMMTAHETVSDPQVEPTIAGTEAADGSTLLIGANCGPYCDGIGNQDADLMADNPDTNVPAWPRSIAEALEIASRRMEANNA